MRRIVPGSLLHWSQWKRWDSSDCVVFIRCHVISLRLHNPFSFVEMKIVKHSLNSLQMSFSLLRQRFPVHRTQSQTMRSKRLNVRPSLWRMGETIHSTDCDSDSSTTNNRALVTYDGKRRDYKKIAIKMKLKNCSLAAKHTIGFDLCGFNENMRS